MQIIHSLHQARQLMQGTAPHDGMVADTIKSCLRTADCDMTFCSSGNSMLPLIRKGDILAVRPATGASLNPGDIVMFDSHNVLCCHRLMAKHTHSSGLQLITKADTSHIPDIPIAADSVLGNVVSVKRKNTMHCFSSFPWNAFNRCLTFYHMALYRLYTVYHKLRYHGSRTR